MAIIRDQQASELSDLIDQPQQAGRSFWTAKAFHGYIGEAYQVECSYETVVRFFHKQGFALKTPQPWPDKQDEQLREKFLQWIFGLQMSQVLKEILAREDVGIKRDEKPV